MSDLGRRAVACKAWRWMPGMLAVWPNGARDRITERTIGIAPGGVPDLADSATRGCVVELLQGAYGGKIVVTQGNGWWSVETEERRWDNDSTSSLDDGLVLALAAS